MKILYVTSGYYPYSIGGVETYTYHLAHAMSAENKVSVFTRYYDHRQKNYDTFQRLDGPVSVFGIMHAGRYQTFADTYQNPRIEEIFAQYLATAKPDLVHVQHCYQLSIHLIDTIAKLGIPTVLTVHDFWYLCPILTGIQPNGKHCLHDLSQRDCSACFFANRQPAANRWVEKIVRISPRWLLNIVPENLKKNIRAQMNMRGRRIPVSQHSHTEQLQRDAIVRERLSQISTVIFPSQFAKNSYQAFGISPKTAMVEPIGLPLDGFNLFKQSPSTTLRFGYLGSFQRLKGIHVLLRAFQYLEKENCRLTIYGNPQADASYYQSLKKFLRQPNITLGGAYEQKDLPAILANLDVVVLPSLAEEVYPLVVREAFAAKIPVIATRVGSIPDTITDGINGFLVAPGDEQALAEKMILVVKNPTQLKDMAKHIPVVPTMETHAKNLQRMYQNLVRHQPTDMFPNDYAAK